jgi:two-component system, cell cycle sensor histidine kinase and response regulator CckA
MNEDTLGRIFEPFYTTKDAGNGLGLANVHGIVTQSGGSVAVSSRPGEGTTFTIRFPLCAAPSALDSDAKPGAPAAAPGAGEPILLVEDDPVVREVVSEMLGQDGYSVVAVSCGDDALEALASSERRFELLVTDLVMPRIGGGELAQKIRVLQPDIHVLFMSGYADDATAERGILVPGAGFIQKPFGADDLARAVCDELGSTRRAA